MTDSIMKIICEVLDWNWGSIIQSVTGIATLVIAWVALGSWKTQQRSHKITELLDRLTDSVHEFVQSISAPVQHVSFIHIGMESCKYDREINNNLAYPEAIRFIEKEGRENSARLMESLNASENSNLRIRSLLIKGQIYGIENYEECMKACNLIVWQYDRLQALRSMLRGQNMNWEHPKVIEQLGKVLEITAEDINKHLSENQMVFLNFVQSAYKKLYENA